MTYHYPNEAQIFHSFEADTYQVNQMYWSVNFLTKKIDLWFDK